MSVGQCEEGARATGTLFELGTFRVPTLPEDLRVTLYLPPGYDASNAVYPLAIFFDGQNLFDDAGSYRGGWQLHRLLDYRACRGETVPVVAAIHTTGWSRTALLSPWSREDAPGLGDRTLDWITEWLLPTLRSELRIARGAERVLLGGSSLGGLLALYGFFRHPDRFGKVAAMSPSLGISGGRHGPLFPYAWDARRGGGKVYLDAGQRECECTNIMRHAGDLASMLREMGYRDGVDLWWRPDPEGSHDEMSWKRRLPGAIDFLCERTQ
jgi:predicted alpha/beta superfamily hydrolase